MNADAESVAAFFEETCAPADEGALVTGGKWGNMCTACQVRCRRDGRQRQADNPTRPSCQSKLPLLAAPPKLPGRPSLTPPILSNSVPCPATLLQGNCSSTDLYADYPGTLRGLMEDACDVAFTKETVPLEYSMDGTERQAWSTLNKVRLRSWRQRRCILCLCRVAFPEVAGIDAAIHQRQPT